MAAPSDAGSDADGGHIGDDASDAPSDDADFDAPDSSDGDADAADADGGETPDAEEPDAGADADVECTRPEEEWCDGRDNDCDGVIDNGHVCPDTTVANTDPFSDGVFLQGTTAEGSCNADALQQFWPTLLTNYYTDFGCYADRYNFRGTDGQIFAYETFTGIVHYDAAGNSTTVQTPPCGDQVRRQFGFDGQGLLHYQCSDTLRRGNGDLVAFPIQEYVVTLDDGRTVALMASNSSGSDYVVLDDGGQELARLDPRDEFIGTMEPVARAVSKAGNKAYVLFKREWGQDQREYVAYRLTAQNQWQLMRRVDVDSFGRSPLVISDGTIFVNESDPATTFDNQIVAYPPSGGSQVVWREANASTVRQHIGEQMLVGPKNSP